MAPTTARAEPMMLALIGIAEKAASTRQIPNVPSKAIAQPPSAYPVICEAAGAVPRPSKPSDPNMRV